MNKLKQDNDCHWYVIPVSLEEAFDYMMFNRSDEEFEEVFEDYRIDNPSRIVFGKWSEQ